MLATNGRTHVLFAAENRLGLKRRHRVLAWLADTGRSHTGPVRVPSFAPPADERLTHNDRVLHEWLENQDNLIPVHPVDDQVAWAGEPNWTELARLVYGQPSNVFGHGNKARAEQRRQWVCEVARDPNLTIATDHGLNLRMLRAACYERKPRAEEEDVRPGTAPHRRPAYVGPLAGVTPQVGRPPSPVHRDIYRSRLCCEGRLDTRAGQSVGGLRVGGVCRVRYMGRHAALMS